MNTVAKTLAVLLAVVLLALLHRARLISRFRRAIAAQHESYRRGDYQGQLEAAETLKRSAHPTHLYFRGRALLELGRMEEAEACLRQSSIEEYDGHRIALYKDELGQVLVEQQRYDEAIACFESGIPHWPQRGGCHRGIAAALLRQGEKAAESLGKARQAVEIDERYNKVPAGVRDLHLSEAHAWNLGESLATLAWAEAVNSGDSAEVERLLARAFTLCPENAVPVRAKVHYHAGRAYASLGKREKSASQFERAGSVDPKGIYGRLGKAETR
jgi:tetratricopeptide (TPR) repeat protein